MSSMKGANIKKKKMKNSCLTSFQEQTNGCFEQEAHESLHYRNSRKPVSDNKEQRKSLPDSSIGHNIYFTIHALLNCIAKKS